MRLHAVDVEIGLVEQPALVGHVELAFARVEQRHHRRLDEVEAEDAFVDFRPEQPPLAALHAQRGAHRVEQVRHGIGEDHRRGGMDDAVAEQQVGKRAGQEHDPRQRILEVQHRVQVAEPLPEAQPAADQRIVDPQDLRHAARPARTLADMERQPLGGEAGGEPHVDVGGVPAEALQLERGVRILGHRLAGEAIGVLQRLAPQDRARSAEEGRVPQVVARLDGAVEQVALARQVLHHHQVPLHRIGRVEMVRGLQHAELGIALEPANGELEEGARRDVIRVEHADQLRVGLLHRLVEVARLGVKIVVARDVAAADRLGEIGELLPAPVVQDVHREAILRVIHSHRREHRLADDIQALIVGRDVDVDGRPVVIGAERLDHRALERPAGLEEAEQQDDIGVELGQVEAKAEQQAEEALELQRLRCPPIHVAGGGEEGERKDHHRRLARLPPADDQRRDDHDQTERPLLPQVERHRDHEQRGGAEDDPGDDYRGEVEPALALGSGRLAELVAPAQLPAPVSDVPEVHVRPPRPAAAVRAGAP